MERRVAIPDRLARAWGAKARVADGPEVECGLARARVGALCPINGSGPPFLSDNMQSGYRELLSAQLPALDHCPINAQGC